MSSGGGDGGGGAGGGSAGVAADGESGEEKGDCNALGSIALSSSDWSSTAMTPLVNMPRMYEAMADLPRSSSVGGLSPRIKASWTRRVYCNGAWLGGRVQKRCCWITLVVVGRFAAGQCGFLLFVHSPEPAPLSNRRQPDPERLR